MEFFARNGLGGCEFNLVPVSVQHLLKMARQIHIAFAYVDVLEAVQQRSNLVNYIEASFAVRSNILDICKQSVREHFRRGIDNDIHSRLNRHLVSN